MKTNELNNGMKEIYAKPSIEVEEMEVQWEYLGSGSGTSTGGGATFALTGGRNNCSGCASEEFDDSWDY